MAEQYTFPVLKGPEVDELLFAKAGSMGIEAGLAQPSVAGAIVGGISGGIDKGISTNAKIQEAQLRQAQIDNIPLEQRRKEADVAKTEQEVNILEKQLESGIFDLELQNKKGVLQEKAAQVAQKKTDLTNINGANDLITAGADPNQVAASLNTPEMIGSIIRNPDDAQKLLGNLQGKADPTIYQNVIDAVERTNKERKVIEGSAVMQSSAEKALSQAQADYDSANLALTPYIGDEKIENSKDLSIIQGERNPTTGAITESDPELSSKMPGFIKYGSKILPGQIPPALVNDMQKNLQKYQQWRSVAKVDVPRTSITPSVSGGSLTDGGIGLAQAAPVPTPDINAEGYDPSVAVKDIAAKRQEQLKQQMIKEGKSNSYLNMVRKADEDLKGGRPSPAPSTINTPQNTPVPVDTLPITKNTPAPDPLVSAKPVSFNRADADTRLKEMTGLDLSLLVDTDYKLSPATYVDIENLPELENAPAIIKGLVAVESKGIRNAKSKAGAVGLTQLMPAAAEEVGVDRFDPQENVVGGAEYLKKQMHNVTNELSKMYSGHGIFVKPDIRMVLASYNGGFRDIQRGIRRGITDWDDMKEYLKTVKVNKKGEPNANYYENVSYPDKVLTATTAFLKGGNYSDDLLIKDLMSFGVVGESDA